MHKVRDMFKKRIGERDKQCSALRIATQNRTGTHAGAVEVPRPFPSREESPLFPFESIKRKLLEHFVFKRACAIHQHLVVSTFAKDVHRALTYTFDIQTATSSEYGRTCSNKCVNELCTGTESSIVSIDPKNGVSVCERCGWMSTLLTEEAKPPLFAEERDAAPRLIEWNEPRFHMGKETIAMLVQCCHLSSQLERDACLLYIHVVSSRSKHDYLSMSVACMLSVLHDLDRTRSLDPINSQPSFPCTKMPPCSARYNTKREGRYHVCRRSECKYALR